jgi:hypothetical protein
MLHRWGPNVKEMMAIKKYLATQSISFSHPPWVRYIQNTSNCENITFFCTDKGETLQNKFNENKI